MKGHAKGAELSRVEVEQKRVRGGKYVTADLSGLRISGIKKKGRGENDTTRAFNSRPEPGVPKTTAVQYVGRWTEEAVPQGKPGL